MEKNLLADFEQSNKKCLEAKAEPFTIKNTKEKKNFVKQNMPEKITKNKNKNSTNNTKMYTTNNRDNSNKIVKQNPYFQRSVSMSPEQRYNNNNNTVSKAWSNRQPSVFRKNNSDQINQKRSNYVQKTSNYNTNSNFNTSNQNRSFAQNGHINNNINGNFRQAVRNPVRP